MAYFIFNKDLDGVESTLYKIAANQSDYNNLNLNESNYKVIQDTTSNFEDVVCNIKIASSYNENTINFITVDRTTVADGLTAADLGDFQNQTSLDNYINQTKKIIKRFLDGNSGHAKHTEWTNYYNQLDAFDTSTVTYPLNKSFEQHLKDNSQTYLNTLQLP